ncbi:MAG: glycosyl transferase family 1 [Dehalococcoidia bacterium]|nr:glycosyl transferase family 1 [Dehalococcoidia bacterium]
MRLLVLNWFDRAHPLAGGAEVFLHEIFGRLARAGNEVTLLCCPFRGGSRDAELDGIHVRRRGDFWTFQVQAPLIYWREFARQPFDLVVDFTNKVPFAAPWWSRRPVVAVAHHLFGRTIFAETTPLPALYVYALERLLPALYRQTPFVAVSESTRRDLIRRGIDSAIIEVIHNGVDTERFTPQPAAREERPTILCLGRVRRYKQLDVLLRALHRLAVDMSDVQLWIAGDGRDLPRLRRLAIDLGLGDRVTFFGRVSESDKIELLRRATLLAQPSSKEGWGLTVLEANACGTPAVASAVPGLRESVRDGVTGLLAPSGDVGAWVGQLRRLLTDRTLHARLAAAGRPWAEQFSWEAAAAAMTTLCRDTVAESR